MFWTKLWPVKLNSDGKIVKDLFHPAFILQIISYLVCVPVVFYFIWPGLKLVDYSKLSSILATMILCSIYLTPLTVKMILLSAISPMDASICDSKTEIPNIFIYEMLGNVLLAVVLTVTTHVQQMPNISCLFITDYIIFFICLFVVNLHFVAAQLTNGTFVQCSALYMKSTLKTMLDENETSVDCLRRLTGMLRKVSMAIGKFSVNLFMPLQISFIFGFYLMVTYNSIFPVFAVTFLATNYFIMHILLNKIEEVYELVHQTACKARDKSAESKSISEMMKIQAAVVELEACVPFTGLGYFTIEKSTLTAMAANTLTYLIVLVQFKLG